MFKPVLAPFHRDLCFVLCLMLIEEGKIGNNLLLSHEPTENNPGDEKQT